MSVGDRQEGQDLTKRSRASWLLWTFSLFEESSQSEKDIATAFIEFRSTCPESSLAAATFLRCLKHFSMLIVVGVHIIDMLKGRIPSDGNYSLALVSPSVSLLRVLGPSWLVDLTELLDCTQ